MSDDTGYDAGPAEAESAPAGAGVTDSGVSGEGVGAEATPSAPPEYLDTDTYAGHHVRVRADGEDLDVPLSEVLAGYSRQADYTRKTQALAEQQRQVQYGMTLQQALENNPEVTLRLLQDQYGQAPQSPTVGDDEDTSWLDDPTDIKMREYDQRLGEFEQWKADQDLRVAIRTLQQQFGDDFDANQVVGHAMQTGRLDLANIHKEMMFDRFWAQQQAEREVQQRREADEARRVQSKASLTPQIGGSSSNVVESTETASPRTVAEAYYQAKAKMGLT